jgi:predicted component of viral defense system (DUF524 family)
VPTHEGLKCETGDSVVRLVGPVCFDPTGTRVELQEWAEYLVRIDDQVLLQVGQGRVPAECLSPDLWRVRYQNHIGLSAVRVTLGGRPLPALLVEVRSNKFASLAQQRVFYHALVDDLWQLNSRLPFTFFAPTVYAVDEAPQPPSPLFVYHFLRNRAGELSMALETVLGAPHRALYEEDAVVPLSQVSEVDADVIDWIVTNPEHWVRAPHLAVARHLDGHAPARVWQCLADEIFDTPPNRFVRRFLRELAGWVAHSKLADYASHLAVARGAIETALHDPLFDEVSEMRRFPAESQVLLKRDGYRELFGLWRLFHLARRPFFGPLGAAIDSRDVATLYEFWCFFALAEQVGAVLGIEPNLALKVDDTHDLRWYTKATFPGTDWKLTYNSYFGSGSGSYSVGLRPDFALTGPGELLVFDAKFRLEATEWNSDGDDTSANQAKRADLYKMHTYRDALGARAAVALYPGERAEFYDATYHQPRGDVTLADLVVGEWQGVGALPLRPDR